MTLSKHAKDDICVIGSRASVRPVAPGSIVCHREFDKSSHGMVISVIEDDLTVLWTKEPKEIDTDFQKLAVAFGCRLNHNQIANQVFKIEHMPSGAHSFYANDDEE